MRWPTVIIALSLACGASAQSTVGPCVTSRKAEEVKARIKEIDRRLSIIESELASLRNDTIDMQPAERVQRIDSLEVIRTRGKDVLLELDSELQRLPKE